ncbi:F-box domain-containing protein [Pochonia chlamydosporia 170]|uniref:F-box domain-containing protein n=1 Tax=Pochonia chlamydosporia 170 TaxID=1380566 RepID=A0A179FZ27_METCM|nr:F-box domain-containing protein [Pochonia chlamydosporia 170]OAQ70894.1 F-box domain-containing protein [Pochonia chlamydosporia 170]
MGQLFTFVAPRQRLTLSWGGKLGEMVFDGSAKELIELLTVIPRHEFTRKQTTVDPRVTVNNLPAKSTCHDATKAVNIAVNVAVKRKADAETPENDTQASKKACYGNNPLKSRPVTFSDLPTELHRHIFFHMESKRYLFTSGTVKLLGLVKISSVLENTSKKTTTPPGLFSKAEVEALGKEKFEIYDEGEEEYEVRSLCTLYDFTLPDVSRSPKDCDLGDEVRDLRCYFLHLREPEKAALNYILEKLPDWLRQYRAWPKTDQSWILRNLTTREFVRAEAIALKPEFIHGPDIDVLGFGEVLLSRICWSSDDSCSMMDTTNICRGVWAGHCFDITTLASHQEKTANGEEWTDASEEVAQEMAKIYESNCGTDWREELCREHRRVW